MNALPAIVHWPEHTWYMRQVFRNLLPHSPVALVDRSLLGKYVEDNPNFRNRLVAYLVVFYKHHRNLKTYKEEGAKLAEEINNFLENR